MCIRDRTFNTVGAAAAISYTFKNSSAAILQIGVSAGSYISLPDSSTRGLVMGAGSDSNISRLGASSLAVGNGTAGNTSGKLTTGSFSSTNTGAASTPNYADVTGISGMYFPGSNQVFISSNNDPMLDILSFSSTYRIITRSNGVFCWSSTTGITDSDTGFSRLAANSIALGNSTAGDFSGSLKLGNETLTSAAPTVAAAQVGLGSTTATTVGAAGAATALPANPVGYLIINVAGTAMKIPYYNN